MHPAVMVHMAAANSSAANLLLFTRSVPPCAPLRQGQIRFANSLNNTRRKKRPHPDEGTHPQSTRYVLEFWLILLHYRACSLICQSNTQIYLFLLLLCGIPGIFSKILRITLENCKEFRLIPFLSSKIFLKFSIFGHGGSTAPPVQGTSLTGRGKVPTMKGIPPPVIGGEEEEACIEF